MASELLDLVDEVDASASERAEMLLSVAITRYVQGELEQALHATERLRSLGPEISATELVPALCMAGVIKIIIGNASAGQSDLSEGITLARHDHAVIYATAVAWETDLVVLGFRLADGALVEETSHALRAAERDGDTYALSLARWAHGTALLRNSDMQRANALELLHQSCVDGINGVSTWCDAEFSEELARHDQLDGAIDLLTADVRADLDQHERFLVGYPAAVLVRLLLERNGEGDRGRALEIIAQLEAGRAPDVPATHLWPLHCRALLAAATDDLSDRVVSFRSYRDLAASLGASGHLLFAEQMTARMTLNR